MTLKSKSNLQLLGIDIDLEEYFTENEIRRGAGYAATGNVLSITPLTPIVAGHILVKAKVQGSRNRPYEQRIEITEDLVDGDCSCPMDYNCKHVMAVLFALKQHLEQQLPRINLDEALTFPANNWIHQLRSIADKSQKPSANEVVLYTLSVPNNHLKNHLHIITQSAKKLKKGGLGKPVNFYPSSENKRERIDINDLEIFTALEFYKNSVHSIQHNYYINGESGQEILKRIIATGRCYWETTTSPPLAAGPEIAVKLEWIVAADGTQSLACKNEQGMSVQSLPLVPPYYVDKLNSQVGLLKTDLPDDITSHLLTAPNIPPSQVKQFVSQLTQNIHTEIKLPVPKTFNKVIKKEEVPKPQLNIHPETIKHDYFDNVNQNVIVADIAFGYGNHTISINDNSNSIIYADGDDLIQTPRDRQAESHFIDNLSNLGLDDRVRDGAIILADEHDLESTVYFGEEIAPELETYGWKVNYSHDDLLYDLLAVEDWYSDLDEESEFDWFGLDLGITVNGEKISLLPHLIKAIDHLDYDPESNKTFLQLGDKKAVLLPTERIQSIMSVITQFIDPRRVDSSGVLKLSRYQASLLTEIEKAFKHTQLRWIGGENLRKLGQKLSNFKRIKSARLPNNFKATLRPYQQQGVSWLQFLREYQLNGILADDMGLGKTIQTLAHILIEKHHKRLDKPCLIIAPTSVLANWKIEAEKFTPSLKVLTLRGSERKANFSNIPNSDIVVTTYPLIVRDKEQLLKYTYHMLILDEAQHIKNSQAKMTQIVQQFNANCRLCLTGTPLENHLGELWSLFNFLMPGLLGSRRDFGNQYRTPIEKHRDTKALKRLNKIIKPFILHRTKSEVVNDLPAKSEITQTIELTAKQRDLYESIRLAMNKKVREAIDKKGIERCQIVILDALLKLRQVCCDPRLVKLDAAKSVEKSAKLELLKEMVSEMVEEGRRILIFSQFTSMLKLIEEELTDSVIDYVKLTGSTKDRITPIKMFQDKQVPVFLISLKAGGTGINLTAADTVIHYDPWWNPAVEAQATDRAHRIGQTNPVFVYKLITQGTVEEKIIAMQDKKKSLIDALLAGKASNAKITRDDLNFLLGQ
jgi:SNF2 family DNA or RNA helicase